MYKYGDDLIYSVPSEVVQLTLNIFNSFKVSKLLFQQPKKSKIQYFCCQEKINTSAIYFKTSGITNIF